MPKSTNYNLQLDSQEDFYDIKTHNDNYTIIDTEIKKIEDKKINNTDKTTIGEANKILVFSDVSNTIKHIFKIMKTSVNAFRVANDSDTEVFNIDTVNGEITGSSISMLEIARKIVKRDSNGKIAGLENVNNTSDQDKPVSTAQQTALDLKLSISEVAETGASKVVKRNLSGNIANAINLNGDKTIDLGNDKDLNAVTSTGLYRANSTATNVPFAGGTWHLEVISYTNLWIFQRVKNFVASGGGGNGETYERICYNGIWSPWIRMATVNDLIGIGQTWQDVTASRTSAITYTNSTGKPIEVIVSGLTTASLQGIFEIYVNSVTISLGQGSSQANTNPYRRSISFIVPVGATYRVDYSLNTVKWFELR